MKKKHMYMSAITLLLGVLLGTIAQITDTEISGLLFSLAGGLIGGGGYGLFKYIYWSRPKNQARYQERLEEEAILLHDERKEMFRNKAGRYAYIVGLVTVAVSILVFSLLGTLKIIDNTSIIVLYLYGYLIFQFVIGVVIFQHLDKKY